MPLRCFIQEQAPIPGTAAHPVHYPMCEWVGDEGQVDLRHPLNRWVCSWLTSDMAELQRCDDVLQVMTQIEDARRSEWFVDGDAFAVDLHAHAVQFNLSHVTPEDAAYWNQPDGQFTLPTVKAVLLVWRDFLAVSHSVER